MSFRVISWTAFHGAKTIHEITLNTRKSSLPGPVPNHRNSAFFDPLRYSRQWLIIIMHRRLFLLFAVALGAFVIVTALPLRFSRLQEGAGKRNETPKPRGVEKVTKTDAEWKQILTADQYRVMREKGTEPPYTSPLNDNEDSGTFACAACGLPLYSSEAKFDSGTGWPSFSQPIAQENVREEVDQSLWQTRTEVLCARCDAHLGHVFPDGPRPTGLRYCMNGVALKFEPEK